MKNQRGNMQLVIILVLVGIVIAVLLVQQKSNILPKAATPESTINQTDSSQVIQNDSDLTKTSDSLDNTDINIIDSSLNQNDTDSSNF